MKARLAIIVCGGRDYGDAMAARRICEKLDIVHRSYELVEVVTGSAKGADTRAADWARDNDVRSVTFAARWNDFGKSAGMIRNKKMLEYLIKLKDFYADLMIGVVAFPGGVGTANMKKIAEEAGVAVWEPIRIIPAVAVPTT